MELVRNWQGTRVILLVRQFQASLDAGLLCSRIWPNLCAGRFYTAPYCASYVILLRYRIPLHSYGLVTGTFPEHPWNPIYMHLCHIFLYLYISEIFLTLLSSSLVVRWLENWRWNMYYLGLTHLIAGSAPSCDLIIAYLLPVYVCRFHVLRLEV